MATFGKFRIDGLETAPPRENPDITIEASFGSDSVQPKINPLEFTFVNEAAKSCRDHIADGKIFEGLCFDVDVIGEAGTLNVMKGFLDLASKFEEISPVQVVTEAKFSEGVSSLDENIQALTLDLLDDLGVLTDADYLRIPYVVEKPINAVELIIASVTLFLMIKELAESVEKLAEDIATALGLTGTGVTGGIGAIIYNIAVIILRAAYIAILLKAIIDLIRDILEMFISPVRQHKGLRYRTILEKGFQYLGYGFESPITDLDNRTYLPSSPSDGEPLEKGIPRPQDFGYNFSEMISLMTDEFNARIAELDGVIHFRTESDPFWLKTSTYKLDDILLEDVVSKQYNTNELTKSRILEYNTDPQDDWTLDNFKGTNYTIITQHNPDSDLKKSGLKKFERTVFPVALGNRKDGLNDLEKALKVLAKAADAVMGVFGNSQNFAGQIQARVGMLKVSNEIHTVPKVLYLVGNKMPVNHRDLLSAKYNWDNFINEKSFVQNNGQRQRAFYENVEIGFGLNDFLATIRNSYFTTNSGKIGKFVDIRWAFNKDRAIVNFWIQETYTDKLKEITIETE